MNKKFKRFNFGIPDFNVADQFTYFLDLQNTGDDDPDPHKKYLKNHKEHLFNKAVAELNRDVALINDKDAQDMSNALRFLERAAENERRKEMKAVRSYQEKLRGMLPKNKDIDKILKRMERTDFTNPQQVNNFYANLTEIINVLRTNTEDYVNRLRTWAIHNQKEMNELAKDDYRFRAGGDIHALLTNLSGMATKAQEKDVDSFSKQLRKIVSNYVTSPEVIKIFERSPEDIAAIVAAIALDIEHELQKYIDSHRDKFSDFADLLKEENFFDNFLKEYSERDYEHQTKVQKAILQDSDELIDILNGAKDVLGIETLTSASDIAARARSTGSRLSKISTENSMYKTIEKRLKREGINMKNFQDLKLISISSQTSTSHGNLFELIETIIQKNMSKVSGTPATDTMGLGSIAFEFLTEKINGLSAQSYIRQITEVYTRVSKEKREERSRDMTKIYKDMNDEVEEHEKQLLKFLEKLNSEFGREGALPEFFVYHESLKLYKGMETGDSDAFHGREMIILNYIDEMYSMNGYGDLVLPQKDALYFIALNLSREAVGHNVRDVVGRYLSVFAGLLMFDDVQNIAISAARELESESTGALTNIHLYNLNGVYVPASMILTYTHGALTKAFDLAVTARGAKVSISTSEIDADIAEFLKEENPVAAYGVSTYDKLWPIMGNKASSGTKVRVAFFSAFSEFLNTLLKRT